MTNTIVLDVRDLNIAFLKQKQEKVAVVKDVRFTLPANQMVALVGESGSGKSVTALAIMGLLDKKQTYISPTSDINFMGQHLLTLSSQKRRQLCGKKMAMIFQDPMTSLNPLLTIGFQLREILQLHQNMTHEAAYKQSLMLLEEVGITEPAIRIEAYPHELSGGQQQRVMIAMALSCEPLLLIADEPTTALDVTIQKQILTLIHTLCTKRNMAVLFITHDLALVKQMAHQVIIMRHGQIVEVGKTKDIFEAPQHLYTQALLHCRPSLTKRPWHLPVMDDYIKRDIIPLTQKERTRGLLGNEDTLLTCVNISKTFYKKSGWLTQSARTVVDKVSFTLAKGKTLGIVGESGSGKTTLALMLLRLAHATSGEVWFEGNNILAMSEKAFTPYKRRLQIIFQNPYACLNPRLTVGHILLEPMRIHQIGNNDTERVALAYQWLDKVALPQSAFDRYPHQFSGGQRQRIAIARCLTMQPDVLICDESVSALDVSIQAQILNLLQDLQDTYGLSYLFISHDLAVVKYMADQMMVMHHGKVVEIANADTLYTHPQHPYTQTLLQAMPMV